GLQKSPYPYGRDSGNRAKLVDYEGLTSNSVPSRCPPTDFEVPNHALGGQNISGNCARNPCFRLSRHPAEHGFAFSARRECTSHLGQPRTIGPEAVTYHLHSPVFVFT